MSTEDFLVDIAGGALDVLSQVSERLSSVESFERVLFRHGWQSPETRDYFATLRALFAFLDDVPSLAAAVSSLRGVSEPDAETVRTLIESVRSLLNAVQKLGESGAHSELPAPVGSEQFWSTFAGDVLQTEICIYLAARRPGLFAVLRFFGIIDEQPIADDWALGRISHVELRLRWSRLGTLFQNPRNLMADVYGWGGQFDHGKLNRAIASALSGFDVPTESETPTDAVLNTFYSDDNSSRSEVRRLRLPFLIDVDADGFTHETGIQILPIPPEDDRSAAPVGVALSPYFEGEFGLQIPLGGLFNLDVSADVAAGTLAEWVQRPGKTTVTASPGTTSGTLAAKLVAEPDDAFIGIGREDGSRVEFKDAFVGFEIVGALQDPDLRFRLGTNRARIVVKVAEGDGFLTALLGGLDIDAHAALAVVWSAKSGLSFEGAGGMRINRAIQLTLGPVKVIGIGASIASENQKTRAQLTVSATAAIGPVGVVIQDIGAALVASQVAPGAARGLLGDLDLTFGFAPPTGAGISINAASVSGGGFLTFEESRYTGALHLKFNQIAMSAFGVIDTKLPDGQEGFSFVILISAEFQPIQLGLGFTLNGVGGLAGLNRTVDIEALRDVVRKGTMDALLFPKNPALDAATIISTLSEVFPPAKDRHVFGPMAKIGWGTPTLIEGKLGLLLELPEPLRLTLLGTVSAELPKKKDGALVKLKMDVLGVLDFAEKSLAIDARLHDSQVGGFPISGDMAMRLRWGDQPAFALAVGGLNPNFEPPAGFPALERVRIDLGKGENPSIGVSAYLAITSNTAQIGARAELKASGSGIVLHGWIGFDALFIFTPFQFVADFDAGVRVSFHGIGKSITLRGRVSGPGPYRVTGKVSVSVAFWDASLSFDETFGKPQKISIPEVDPWDGNDDFPGLGKALADVRNWQSEPPPDAAQVVSLRTRTRSQAVPSGQPDDLIGVDPLGTAMFRQRVVPLNQEITRFGSVPLKETRLYKVASVSISNSSAAAGASVQELFAPGQYRTMKDAERVSSPSFELMDAGFKLTGTEHAEGPRMKATVKYKTSFIGGSGVTEFSLPSEEMPKLVRRSASARVGVDTTDLRRFVDRTAPRKITIDQPGWVVALRKSLQRYPAPTTKTTSYTAAATALAKLIGQNVANRQVYTVVPSHEIETSEVP